MLKIERATNEDEDQLCVLLQEQFLEHDIRVTTAQLKSALGQLLAQESLGFVLMARTDGQLVGLAAVSFAWTLEHGGKSAWLDELYVLPDFRNNGIGTMLVERVIVEAQESCCRAIDLETDGEHQRAENLYERQGFRRLARNRWVKSAS